MDQSAVLLIDSMAHEAFVAVSDAHPGLFQENFKNFLSRDCTTTLRSLVAWDQKLDEDAHAGSELVLRRGLQRKPSLVKSMLPTCSQFSTNIGPIDSYSPLDFDPNHGA